MIRSTRVVINSLQKAKRNRFFSPSSRACASGFVPLDKFDEVLSFHGGIAAVHERNGDAYHVDKRGAALYHDCRYKRAFGFYEQRAVVIDFDDKFLHIDLNGYPVYDQRYNWCGNFHAVPEVGLFRSPVRDSNNHYFYIDLHGEKTLGPFSYAGDPNSAGQSVVYDFDGNPNIVNLDGGNWWTNTDLNKRKLIEACAPHKGIAVVRDEEGWFYMNQLGEEVGSGRYLFAEPHYNGQARVRFQNGQWGVVDEDGRVVVNLGESLLSGAVELENISKSYWQSFALKHILENNVLQEHYEMPLSSDTKTRFEKILKNCSVEMGLIRREQPSNSVSDPTAQQLNRGALLTARSRDDGDISSVTEERCKYWLQDRYMRAWLDCSQSTTKRDVFAELASDPVLVRQSQSVLKSYADEDWKGAAEVLSKLLHSKYESAKNTAQHPCETGVGEPLHTIVDMGGGSGSLLRELKSSDLFSNTKEFVCVDRPEVVAAAAAAIGVSASSSINPGARSDHQQPQINNSKSDRITYEVGDLFEGQLPSAGLYLMSRVLHDWSDVQAEAILEHIHSQSPEDARLAVIDRVATSNKLHALLSLHMFAVQGSHERSHEEWQKLFETSRWQIVGREHFNGHELYMLAKTKGADTYSSSALDNEDTSSKSAVAVAGDPNVRKAVITAGGMGTRMAPQSSITPKALLPVITPGHICNSADPQPPRWEVRPALSFILDQLRDSSHNIDQVCIVSTAQQIPLLRAFVHDYHQQQQQQQQPCVTADTSTRTTNKELAIEIVEQNCARGFGDAVLSAREFVGGDPFLLAIGDHIFSADCVKDMLAVHEKLVVNSDWRNTGLTGVAFCNESEVQYTGLLRNQQCEYLKGISWLVDQMVEKPNSHYDSFQVMVDGSVKYPSQLGIDILPPSIFEHLQSEEDQTAPHLELDLRKVLKESLQHNGRLFGCLINGHNLDLGNPRSYFLALQKIANDVTSTYLPPRRLPVPVQKEQEQDSIVRSILAIQNENSVYVPDTLRHTLFCKDGIACSDSSEIHISSAPGRMDVMCGFADYSGSFAIQHPTAERVVTLSSFEDSSNLQSLSVGRREQGMIRLASIEVANLTELARAIAKGNFIVREAQIPTKALFNAGGQPKSDADLRTTLSDKFAVLDGPDRWVLYLTGIIHRLFQKSSTKTKEPIDAGFTVVTISDLPMNTGLASSAAVEVATAISVGNALQLPTNMLEPVPVSMLCKEVENNVVGGQCGIMDHLAVTHPGARTMEHTLVGMRCRMPFAEQPTYSLPLPEGVSVIALESGVKRSTVSTAYQRVRTGALVGKYILESSLGKQIHNLCDVMPSHLTKYEDRLPVTITDSEIRTQFPGLISQGLCSDENSSITYPVRAATSFPVEENLRVQMFEQLLRGLHSSIVPQVSGLKLLGELMQQTHSGYDNCGLGTEATSFLVGAMQNRSDVIGAKLSGGGGGGAIVALVNDSFLRSSAPFEQLQESYFAKTGLTCTLRSGTSGAAKYHGALRRHFSTYRGTGSQYHTPRSVSSKLRVLVANHGYPPEFNGGSENYAQCVALQLKNSKKCESVHVFAREHDPYRPDFEIRRTVDQLDTELPVFLMNYSREAPYFRFMAEEIDHAFQEVIDEVNPDIVHLHHMNHLSLNLPAVAKASGAKVLYTLHDYWLMCPRGQFLQVGAARNDPWKPCDGQENSKCSKQCYASRYASGVYDTSTIQTRQDDDEQQYWTSWIGARMKATRAACEHIDVFIAPSQYIYNKFVNEFSLPAEKVVVEPYGFFRDRLANRQRRKDSSTRMIDDSHVNSSFTHKKDPYVFAYTGRHQPGKGINLLVEASLKLLEDTNSSDGDEDIPFRVKIFGRQDANSSRSLQRMIAECPRSRSEDIFSWEPEYVNKDIVEKVFNVVDCVVVPSIWEENSPLVIHEAQQCRVPVITSSYGGMGELVKDSVNGLSFRHRSVDSLAGAMRKAMEQPTGMRHLGERGYLYSSDGQIPCIENHTEMLLNLFQTMRSEDSKIGIAKAASNSWYTAAYTALSNSPSIAEAADTAEDPHAFKQHKIKRLPAPWRVTFDTNPDDCNFSCTMCEQHSEFSPYQKERRENNIKKRRMSFEIIRKTVAELAPKGLKEIIPTTMGEPLYYKHFPKILELCHEHKVKLNLTTNGSFYNGGSKFWAEKIVPVGSDVKISWNGITQETQESIMKGSNLMTQIENLREFVSIRNRIARSGGNYCSVTLQLTFMELNLQEIPQLVKFAIEEDCDRVKGHHLWVNTPEMKNEDLRRSPESIRRWNAIADECREIVKTSIRPSGKKLRLENFFDIDQPKRPQGSPGGVGPEAVCPFLGQEAWVNHAGRFDPCCAPDLQRKTLGNFGNITDTETQLLDIWNSDQYNNLVQNYTQKPICKTCTMRRPTENSSNSKSSEK